VHNEALTGCPPVSDVRPLLLELNKRIQVELKAHTYFYVSKERSAFYQKPLSGWEATEITFPSVRYDIEEAGKCLAFGRTTAAVFHLMRVIGAGVNALGKSLNEPVLDASRNLTWDNVLSRCVKELGEKFSGKSPGMADGQGILRESHSHSSSRKRCVEKSKHACGRAKIHG